MNHYLLTKIIDSNKTMSCSSRFGSINIEINASYISPYGKNNTVYLNGTQNLTVILNGQMLPPQLTGTQNIYLTGKKELESLQATLQPIVYLQGCFFKPPQS